LLLTNSLLKVHIFNGLVSKPAS